MSLRKDMCLMTIKSAALGLAAAAAVGAVELHVSPTGNDAGTGAAGAPLRTLERARDAVRALKAEGGLPPGGVTVWVGEGTYELARTFEIEAQDSGSAASPVVYKGLGVRRARLSGGRRLSADAFRPVSDPALLERVDPVARGALLVCELRDQGIGEFGTVDRQTLTGGAMLEVFVNGRAMPMSRWPNGRDWATYGQVIDAGSVPRWAEKPDRPGTLEYTGDRPDRWTGAEAIWLHGYWAFDWYDDVLQVQTLDRELRRITFTTPHTYGLKSGRRYAALNLIEEIDTPGEWVLERGSGRLYLWPDEALETVEIVVSMLAAPLVRLDRATHVRLENLVFEYGRGTAVVIAGGTDNLVAGCTIRNLGCAAVSIAPAVVQREGQLRVDTGDERVDGRRHVVSGCDIYHVGTGGISITGGDRRRLISAGHAAINNDIHHYSRRKRTNCPAITLDGVGLRAAHNAVHDAPHMGILYGGNDHVIELNELYRLCWETGDVGAIYSGRDWTFRGNHVRHNFIHDTLAPGQVGSMGVYLDDSHSSTAIVGNVFSRNDYAAFIGGGRDNLVENNLFVDCRKAVHLDNRSQGWANKYQVRGGDHRMYEKLEEVRHDQPPYSERYPDLARILDENPHEPRGNRVRRNVCVGTGTWLHLYPGAEAILEVTDNLTTADDPGFVDAAGLNFALRPDSRVFRELPGFAPIPFDRIGPHLDAHRLALPLRAPRLHPDGGTFSRPVAVQVGAPPEGYALRYTLDGSEPTPQSSLAVSPLVLSESALLSVAAFPLDDPSAPASPARTARFVRVDFGEGKGVFLSDLDPEQEQAHGGLIRDRNYRGNDFITLSGSVHRRGIMLHPAVRPEGGTSASVVYRLDPPLNEATRLRAVVGIDDGGDERGSASFTVEVWRDEAWQGVFESPVLRGRPHEEQLQVDVDIHGAAKLRLSTDGGANNHADHAVWADARLE